MTSPLNFLFYLISTLSFDNDDLGAYIYCNEVLVTSIADLWISRRFGSNVAFLIVSANYISPHIPMQILVNYVIDWRQNLNCFQFQLYPADSTFLQRRFGSKVIIWLWWPSCIYFATEHYSHQFQMYLLFAFDDYANILKSTFSEEKSIVLSKTSAGEPPPKMADLIHTFCCSYRKEISVSFPWLQTWGTLLWKWHRRHPDDSVWLPFFFNDKIFMINQAQRSEGKSPNIFYQNS